MIRARDRIHVFALTALVHRITPQGTKGSGVGSEQAFYADSLQVNTQGGSSPIFDYEGASFQAALHNDVAQQAPYG